MKSLAESGYEVIGISSLGPYQKEIEKAGIRHIHVQISRRFTPVKDLFTLISLYKTIKAEKISIVHTHFAKPGLLGQLAARAAGVPVIVNTIHGFYFTDNTKWLKKKFYILMEKIAARCSSLIFSVNQEDIQTAINEDICSADKIKLIGTGGIGIDLTRYAPRLLTDEWRRMKCKELGLAGDGPVVGFVGRVVKEKGIIDLIKAAQIIISEIPAVEFLIVGPFNQISPMPSSRLKHKNMDYPKQ